MRYFALTFCCWAVAVRFVQARGESSLNGASATVDGSRFAVSDIRSITSSLPFLVREALRLGVITFASSVLFTMITCFFRLWRLYSTRQLPDGRQAICLQGTAATPLVALPSRDIRRLCSQRQRCHPRLSLRCDHCRRTGKRATRRPCRLNRA